MKPRYVVGIDPGVSTGFAVYDRHEKVLLQVSTLTILTAMTRVLDLIAHGCEIELLFEDARLRRFFGTKGREVLQGAGSIKRDCSIWQEFCELHGIKYTAIAPQNARTKVDAVLFGKLTGYTGRTSEHSRDASMLVFGA